MRFETGIRSGLGSDFDFDFELDLDCDSDSGRDLNESSVLCTRNQILNLIRDVVDT